MKICVLLPGRIKPKELSAAEAEYARRLAGLGVETLEYKDERIGSRAPEQVKQAEAERIGRLLKPGDYLVACDERGEAVRTDRLAELVRRARRGEAPFAGRKRIVVVVGGALGLAESIHSQADAVWALSALVMAGGVARIVLLEGLYRAITIVDGHPYHNE